MNDWLKSRHESVFEHIQAEIIDGRLGPGTRLTGERSLAESLGVSRDTVRQGLRLAERSGLIVRLPTLGTFVAPPRVEQDLGEMDAFDSTVRQLQLNPTYQSISVSTVSASNDQASRLGISSGDDVLKITAIGMGNDLPLAYYESLLPEGIAKRLPPAPPWETQATYQVAARAVGAESVNVAQEFDAIGMPRAIAQILKVAVGSPGFKSLSVFSAGDEPLELRAAWYPGSRYRFRVARRVRL